MEIILKLFFIILTITSIISIALYFTYISKINIYLTKKLPEFTVLDDSIQVKETTDFLDKINKHLDYEIYGNKRQYIEYTEYLSSCKAENYIVNYDGSAEPVKFFLDGEKGPIQSVKKISGIKKNKKTLKNILIGQGYYLYKIGNKYSEQNSTLTNPIAKNEIFYINKNKLGEKHGALTNPDAASIDSVYKMEQGYFMMIADREKPFFRSPKLWSVNFDTLETTLISDNLYPESKRPVMCLRYIYSGDRALPSSSPTFDKSAPSLSFGVYYTGFVRHGWHGDNGHPKKSIIRVYSDLFPDGKDIIEFSFNAGTIVKIDIDTRNPNRLNVMTDASLPGVTGERPVYVREWKITTKEFFI